MADELPHSDQLTSADSANADQPMPGGDGGIAFPMSRFDEPTQRKIQTFCLVVLATLAGTYLIYWLRPVLVPFVVALFVVSGLSPILALVERTLGVTRIVAAAITFLSGCALLILFGCTIWVSVSDLARNSQAYIQRIDDIAAELEKRSPFTLKLRRKPSGVMEPEAAAPPPDRAETVSEETESKPTDPDAKAEPSTSTTSTEVVDENAASDKEPRPNPSESLSTTVAPPAAAQQDSPDVLEAVARQGIAIVSESLLSLVSTSVVVLIFVFFLLLGTPSLLSASETINEINHQVRSYLALKTIISIFTGLAFGLALRIFDVPMAFTFGVLAFLLNFVPNVGPIVASLLPIPLIIFDPEGSLIWMIAVITVTSTIQLISGNIVEPKIMGNSADLHPVVILLSLMFWGMMWGIIGMFLATPIAAGFKIVMERFEETKSIAAFMSGR